MTSNGVLGVKYVVRLGRLFVSDDTEANDFNFMLVKPTVQVTTDWKAAQLFTEKDRALEIAKKFYGDVAEVQFNVDRYITE